LNRHPGEELLGREGLDDVVVRPAHQPVDAIVHGVARGQQDDGEPGASGAPAGEQVDPLLSGQHPVEQHERRRLPRGLLPGLLGGSDGNDLIPGVAERRGHREAKGERVFDE
jgi:hypothetical protein